MVSDAHGMPPNVAVKRICPFKELYSEYVALPGFDQQRGEARYHPLMSEAGSF